jgi:hypothetical protein
MHARNHALPAHQSSKWFAFLSAVLSIALAFSLSSLFYTQNAYAETTPTSTATVAEESAGTAELSEDAENAQYAEDEATIEDDENPMASSSSIAGNKNPLSSTQALIDWVLPLIVVGILVTAVYGGNNIRTRLSSAHGVSELEERLTKGNRR